jgi:hypothetical protein
MKVPLETVVESGRGGLRFSLETHGKLIRADLNRGGGEGGPVL